MFTCAEVGMTRYTLPASGTPTPRMLSLRLADSAGQVKGHGSDTFRSHELTTEWPASSVLAETWA